MYFLNAVLLPQSSLETLVSMVERYIQYSNSDTTILHDDTDDILR